MRNLLHEILVIVVDLLASASSATTGPGATQPISDLEALEQSIKSATTMLGRVLGYVRSVLAGEIQGDPAVGRCLLDTFAASTDDLEKGGSTQVSR
jgi:translation initiation factor 3 subunit F